MHRPRRIALIRDAAHSRPIPAFSRPFPAHVPSRPLPRLRPAPSSSFRLFTHVHSTVLQVIPYTGFHGCRGAL